jgi:5-methylcytosine-specific restriction endonuclease McrA
VQFTASAELRDKLERLRALMRHAVPDGDLALPIDAAVSEKLERLEARRFGRRTPNHAKAEGDAAGPRPRSRHVPAALRRAVFERDAGRCRYTDENGRRCSAREGLEIHHRHPFSHGGGHELGDLSLVCRSHNQRLAEHDFGRAVMDRHRRRHGPTIGHGPPAPREG